MSTATTAERAYTKYAKFDPHAYLDVYYNEKLTPKELALQVKALNELPNPIENLLDLGSGPSVRIALALRNQANNIFFSDYAKANNEATVDWINKKPGYNWDMHCNYIAKSEGSSKTSEQIQSEARVKVQAVLEVDIYKVPVINGIFWKRPELKVVISTFCVTNVSRTLAGLYKAIKHATTLVEDGGYLVLAGIMYESVYRVGDVDFECFPHNIKDIASGMSTRESDGFRMFVDDPVYSIVARKL